MESLAWWPKIAWLTALDRERPRMRCADQSARMAWHGMPQTFSVES
jgi:hypothetical protein